MPFGGNQIPIKSAKIESLSYNNKTQLVKHFVQFKLAAFSIFSVLKTSPIYFIIRNILLQIILLIHT